MRRADAPEPAGAVWVPEGAYWGGPKFDNAWGQPAVIVVELARAGEGEPDGHLGVEIDTFMCETFLLPDVALAFAAEIARVARQGLRAEARRSRAAA